MNNKDDKGGMKADRDITQKEKRKPIIRREKKLTAAERRKIEREKKREIAGDDPLSAFDTGEYRKKTRSVEDDIFNFGGIPNFGGEIDDYYSRTYGDFADERQNTSNDDTPESGRRTEPKPRTDRPQRARIKPASKLTAAQRRRRVILSYVGVFVIIVILAVTLSLTVLFRTTDIRVEGGEVPYSTEEIIKASGLSYNKSIFLSKKKAARKKLVDNYPYIEDANITVRIPSTQIIHISAAVPSYQVQFSGGYAVVSENSRILEVNDTPKSSIPLLKGLRLHETSPGEYITFEKNSTKQVLDEVVKNINENEVKNI